MADHLRQLYHRNDWCEYFQLKIEFSGLKMHDAESHSVLLNTHEKQLTGQSRLDKSVSLQKLCYSTSTDDNIYIACQ